MTSRARPANGRTTTHARARAGYQATVAPERLVPGTTVWFGSEAWVVVHLLDLDTVLARRVRDRQVERLHVQQCELVPPVLPAAPARAAARTAAPIDDRVAAAVKRAEQAGAVTTDAGRATTPDAPPQDASSRTTPAATPVTTPVPTPGAASDAPLDALPETPSGTRPGPRDLLDVPDDDWQVASARYAALAPLLKKSETGRTRAAVQAVADQLDVGIATVYRWLRAYESERQLTVLLPYHPLGGKGRSRLEPTAEALIREVVETFYLRLERPSMAAAAREVLARARRDGLSPAPSPSTITRRIRALAEEQVMRRRHGARAAREVLAPAVGAFPDAAYPLDVWQIDHTKLDVVLVDEVSRRPIGRPWITLVIDVATRCVMGYCLALETPGAAAVGRVLAHAITRKTAWLAQHGLADAVWPCYGLPRTVHADNGREFRSVHVQRAAEQYRIQLEWRPVRRPEFGGHIERLMGTSAAEVQRLPGTLFSDPQARGDYRSNDAAALTFAELERWFARWVVQVYHQRVHASLGIPPLAAWRDALLGTPDQPGMGLPTPVADEERLRLDLLPGETRSVQRYGVQLHGIRYWHDALRFHIGTRADGTRVGSGGVKRGGRPRQYTFRYDPRDLSAVYVVLDAEDGYLRVPYANLNNPPINVWDVRATRAFLRQRGRELQDEAALFAGYAEMRRIEESARAATTKTRREADRRARSERDAAANRPQPASDVATVTTRGALASADDALKTPADGAVAVLPPPAPRAQVPDSLPHLALTDLQPFDDIEPAAGRVR